MIAVWVSSGRQLESNVSSAVLASTPSSEMGGVSRRRIEGTKRVGVAVIIPFIGVGNGDDSGTKRKLAATLTIGRLPEGGVDERPTFPFLDADVGIADAGQVIVDRPTFWRSVSPGIREDFPAPLFDIRAERD